MPLVGPASLGNFESGASHGTGAFANSITAVDNSFLVVALWATLTGTDTGVWDNGLLVSGGGLTFTAEVNQRAVSGANVGGLKVFTAPVAAGATFNLTADCGAGSVFNYKVTAWSYTGHDAGDPVGAVAQGAENPMSGAVAITLGAAPAADSSVLAALGMFTDNVDIVEGAGWAEQHDFGATAGTFCDMQVQSRTGSTSTSVDWATATSSFGSGGHAVAIEIRAEEEGPEPPPAPVAELPSAGSGGRRGRRYPYPNVIDDGWDWDAPDARAEPEKPQNEPGRPRAAVSKAVRTGGLAAPRAPVQPPEPAVERTRPAPALAAPDTVEPAASPAVSLAAEVAALREQVERLEEERLLSWLLDDRED